MNGSDLSNELQDVEALLQEESHHLPEDMIDAPTIYDAADPPPFAKDRVMARVKKDTVTYFIAGSARKPSE